MKILHLDYETAPIEGYFWALWKQNIGLNQIKVDWTILSMSWQWDHERRVHYGDTWENADIRDDRNLLQRSWELLDEADVVVAQNGVRFDLRKIRARLIQNNHAPFSPIRVVDTLLESRKLFGFTSHKQEWMSQILTTQPKGKHKKFPGFELWAEYLKRNPEARAEMRKYNKQDIRGLREVYHRIRPWVEGHPNMMAYAVGEDLACPRCGHPDITLSDKTHKTNTSEYPLYQCGGCGGWSKGRYTVNSIKKRRNLLAAV